jgi:hypothetical protein
MDERRVLTAARRLFLDRGPDVTVESIGMAAGVDPAEVTEHLGTGATPSWPPCGSPPTPTSWSPFLLDTLRLKLIDTSDEPLPTLRAMLTDPDEVPRVQQAANEQADKLAAAMSGPDREVRAAVLRSIMLGVGLGRDLLALRGLTSVSTEEIIEVLRPAFAALGEGPITREV